MKSKKKNINHKKIEEKKFKLTRSIRRSQHEIGIKNK
jgi:hypothetical protein